MRADTARPTLDVGGTSDEQLALVVLGLAGATDRLRGRAGLAAGIGCTAISGFVAISELGHSVLEATLIAVLRDNPSTTNLITADSWLAQSLFSGAFGMMMLVGMVLLVSGALLVGIGTLIEGSYPRWPALLLLVLAPTPFLPFTQGPIAPALMYLGLAGFGYAMLSGAGPEPLRFRRRRRLVSAGLRRAAPAPARRSPVRAGSAPRPARTWAARGRTWP